MELADLKTKQSPQNDPQHAPCTEIGPRACILDACGQLNVDGGHALNRGKPSTTNRYLNHNAIDATLFPGLRLPDGVAGDAGSLARPAPPRHEHPRHTEAHLDEDRIYGGLEGVVVAEEVLRHMYDARARL